MVLDVLRNKIYQFEKTILIFCSNGHGISDLAHGELEHGHEDTDHGNGYVESHNGHDDNADRDHGNGHRKAKRSAAGHGGGHGDSHGPQEPINWDSQKYCPANLQAKYVIDAHVKSYLCQPPVIVNGTVVGGDYNEGLYCTYLIAIYNSDIT